MIAIEDDVVLSLSGARSWLEHIALGDPSFLLFNIVALNLGAPFLRRVMSILPSGSWKLITVPSNNCIQGTTRGLSVAANQTYLKFDVGVAYYS